ncbi:hypothetical protein IWX90DRAFT_31720 [Phyllosticta citrichinensis]|uniref:Uncharacterized protein n=1 Tax=Phyllosticta citrichinensis TaxID=1130410 RepID=A0ABR1Y8L2_9PEZI
MSPYGLYTSEEHPGRRALYYIPKWHIFQRIRGIDGFDRNKHPARLFNAALPSDGNRFPHCTVSLSRSSAIHASPSRQSRLHIPPLSPLPRPWFTVFAPTRQSMFARCDIASTCPPIKTHAALKYLICASAHDSAQRDEKERPLTRSSIGSGSFIPTEHQHKGNVRGTRKLGGEYGARPWKSPQGTRTRLDANASSKALRFDVSMLRFLPCSSV